jgi:hypothetical protein
MSDYTNLTSEAGLIVDEAGDTTLAQSTFVTHHKHVVLNSFYLYTIENPLKD